MKKNRLGLLLLLLIMPLMVLADDTGEMIFPAFIWEAFSSIHVSLFFLLPLQQFLRNKGYEISFWKLFLIRVIVLIIITPFFPYIFMVEFFLMFIGPFLSGGKIQMNSTATPIVETPKGVLVCPKCGKEAAYGNKRCPSCGEDLQTAKYVCPKCHTENIQQARFCQSCGNVLYGIGGTTPTEGVPCPHCKELLLEPMKFCKFCGKNVEKVTANIPLVAASPLGIPSTRSASSVSLKRISIALSSPYSVLTKILNSRNSPVGLLNKTNNTSSFDKKPVLTVLLGS